MTNLVSIAAKTDDKQAAEIAKLRELFDPTYRPQFRVGDIVRFRAKMQPYMNPDFLAAAPFIVTAVRGNADWSGFSQVHVRDDVALACVQFEKELQRTSLGEFVEQSWKFELIDRLPDPNEA